MSVTHRRTTVKALLWRFIGIFWTWGGAFVILLLLPEDKKKDPIIVATLVTVWHHSTRMVMYYLYERIWEQIQWGRDGNTQPLTTRSRLVWSSVVTLSIVLIFWLLLSVTPKIKEVQKSRIQQHTEIQN